MKQEIIKINNHMIEKIEYKGKPVITVDQIGKVHEKENFRIVEVFKSNQDKFNENKDYFRIVRNDANNNFDIVTNDIKEKFFNSNSQKEVFLFTERGYLKLVKPFRDDKSWEIQDKLIDCYFKVKEEMIEKNNNQSLLNSNIYEKVINLAFEKNANVTVYEDKVFIEPSGKTNKNNEQINPDNDDYDFIFNVIKVNNPIKRNSLINKTEHIPKEIRETIINDLIESEKVKKHEGYIYPHVTSNVLYELVGYKKIHSYKFSKKEK